MAHIHLLDEKTINKIAAGEVVERPASVVKELVENAIDAGATNIRVEMAEGGTTFLRIVDNGCGMEEEDARLALLRHATSKIRQVEDLFDIASLGFRGEALASISAVSHFTMRTRTAQQELGTRISVSGGAMEACEPEGCAVGTDITVADLFYNTPARRKFLKKPRTEGNRIQDLMGKLALSHPHIAFTCVQDDRVVLLTPGSGSLVDTVAALYGYKVAKDIFPIAYEGDGIWIEGVAGKPSLIKNTRMWQSLIVNQRVVSDKVIFKAIDRAYHAMVPKGAYPLVVLQVVVPADSIDINVHPRKQEVKFADEQAVFGAVYRAVSQALQSTAPTGESIATDVPMDVLARKADHVDYTPTASAAPWEVPTQAVDTGAINGDYAVGGRQDMPGTAQGVDTRTGGTQPGMTARTAQQDTQTTNLYQKIREEQYRPPTMPKQEATPLPLETDTVWQHESYTVEDRDRFHAVYEAVQEADLPHHGLIPLGQIASCYILAKKEDCLYIIDQHAAHERIRYDALCQAATVIPSQELLVPMHVSVEESEMELVEEHPEIFADLGYTVALAGPTEVKIEAMPVDFLPGKGEEILRFVFGQLLEGDQPSASTLRHEMLAYASCRGAIKAGDILNVQQMGHLIDSLFRTEKPYVCPHGRPTMLRLTTDALAKLFLRA